MPFGGMLGSTFNFVFETQLENLQNGDRFYYLARTAGMNFINELEQNSFASLIMENTDARHLPLDVFSTPAWILEVDRLDRIGRRQPQFNPDSNTGTAADPTQARPDPAGRSQPGQRRRRTTTPACSSATCATTARTTWCSAAPTGTTP